jgi:hypothetical protein
VDSICTQIVKSRAASFPYLVERSPVVSEVSHADDSGLAVHASRG